MADGTTIGIWIGEDDEALLDQFDRTFGRSEPQWSRSEEVKRAMQMHMAVEDAIGDIGYDFGHERDKRFWVQRAIRELAQREAERERPD